MSNKKEMKDLVPSLETCKKFQEMGLFEESVFVWKSFGVQNLVRKRSGENYFGETFIAPAPTLQEILDELPKTINYKKKSSDVYKVYELAIFFDINQINYCHFEDQNYTDGIFNYANTLEGICEFILKLKSENII